MSQHDMTVDNGSGLVFRGDVNNALKALASQSSGPAAPGTTFPCQLWADTGTGRLKQRNAANSAWLDRGALDAALRDAATDGTYVADTGAANAYLCNFVPAIAARSESTPLRFKAANANSGGSTINDGVGTVALVGASHAPLKPGEIIQNGIALIQWNNSIGGTGAYVLVFCTGAAGQVVNQSLTAFTTAGTAPAFTLTPVPAIDSYAAPQRFRVKFHAAGGSSPTINVSGRGPKALKQYDATGAKVVATIALGQLADVEYDGTDAVILDPLPADNWTSKAIGEPFGIFTHLTGVVEPPTTNPNYRFIKLTAADAYNTGVLISEAVSGSAPLVTATATISLAGSPVNGQIVDLMNTSRRVLRAGLSGTAEADTAQGHGFGDPDQPTFQYMNAINQRFTFGATPALSTLAMSTDSTDSTTAGQTARVSPVSDGTNGVPRIGIETRAKNIGVTYYMRIK